MHVKYGIHILFSSFILNSSAVFLANERVFFSLVPFPTSASPLHRPLVSWQNFAAQFDSRRKVSPDRRQLQAFWPRHLHRSRTPWTSEAAPTRQERCVLRFEQEK